MTKIEQVREALEAAKHAMTNQRYLLPRLGTEDAHAATMMVWNGKRPTT